MKKATPRMRLACILISMLPVVACGQQTANQEANAQNAATYNDRGIVKQRRLGVALFHLFAIRGRSDSTTSP
jgi:hypothetical protein